MKLALIAPPFASVPPKGYGGTERILDYLGRELIKQEVDTTLYASGDSTTSVPLKAICNRALFDNPTYNHTRDRETRTKEINKRTLNLLDKNCDLINAHDYDNPDLIERLSKVGIPVLISIRHAETPVIASIYRRFRNHPNIHFHGLTHKHVQSFNADMPYVHNGVDPQVYSCVSDSDKEDYFFSIGDMKPIKAHKTAIDLVKNLEFMKETGLALVIAGAPYYPESKPYFEEHVAPRIDTDVSENQTDFTKALSQGEYDFKPGEVVYFGSASDKDKQILFSRARFTQFLGNFEKTGNIEACPSTTLESLISGTPVLGVKGSVTEELVKDNKTGFNIANLSEAIEKVKVFLEFSPKEIRDEGVERFSAETMTRNYLNLYTQILGKN